MSERLTEIEIKLSYTEDLVDALNLALYRQQQQIEALRDEVRALRQQLQNAPQGQPLSLRDELPPHY